MEDHMNGPLYPSNRIFREREQEKLSENKRSWGF